MTLVKRVPKLLFEPVSFLFLAYFLYSGERKEDDSFTESDGLRKSGLVNDVEAFYEIANDGIEDGPIGSGGGVLPRAKE